MSCTVTTGEKVVPAVVDVGWVVMTSLVAAPELTVMLLLVALLSPLDEAVSV